MKAEIYDDNNEKIFEGEYEYVEGGKTNNNPSFHFSLNNRKDGIYRNYEVHFFCESEEEFEGMLSGLREQVYRNKSEKDEEK